MVDPPAWPEKPPDAYDFDRFWLVRRLPPEPFPDRPAEGWDRATYGPAGTVWTFSTESLINRQALPGTTNATKLAIERLVKKLGLKLPPVGSMSWVVPADGLPPAADTVIGAGVAINVARVVIHGKLGADEEVAHVMHFRTQPTPDVNQAPGDLVNLATRVRDAWSDFLGAGVSPYGQGTNVAGYMPAALQYDEVRASYISVSPGDPVTGKLPRPVALVPTQYVPYVGPVTGGGGIVQPNGTGNSLPYEVAMALSLGTDRRGPRYRGRLYLGPFLPTVMDPQGQFNQTAYEIGKAFGNRFVRGIAVNTPYLLNVLSAKFAESYPVSGVRVGLVPDSQRRRRRARPETYKLQWGTPVGVPFVKPT